jgi:hypothetical protein
MKDPPNEKTPPAGGGTSKKVVRPSPIRRILSRTSTVMGIVSLLEIAHQLVDWYFNQ